MQMESHVQLNRQFSTLSKSQEEVDNIEILAAWRHIEPKTWGNLEHEYRCVILAEAGAGKTEELRHQAKLLAGQGKHSFFIRIEDIEADFYKAFEIGEETQFQTWLHSTEEAWFFLDSVDEARLDNPETFKKALKYFARGIRGGTHRAHIYLSSRPYSWRPKDDKDFLDEILYLPAPDKNDGEVTQDNPVSALTIYIMRPLDIQRIREFCVAHSTEGIDNLLDEIERTNLWSLAERPFDLEGILAKWAEDNCLGSRLGLLRHNIDKRLKDDHNIDRSQRRPLNLEHAREGARRLAAAVVLSGQTGIYVPDGSHSKPGLDAELVLADWSPEDVHALLERGIFNGVIYGMVRFRHREVRELLAAEWFDKLLKIGSRLSVETLFFREQYGEKIITPRLRPILPWLILFDNEVLHRVLGLQPEIAVESGDPSQLPLPVRQRILKDIVGRIVADEDDRSARDNSAIARIANSDLSENALQLINQYNNNDDAIFFLGRLVWQGEMENCLSPLAVIAVDNSRGIYARIVSARAVMTCGTEEQKKCLWQQLNEGDEQIPRELIAEIVQNSVPNSDSVTQLLISLSKLPPYELYKGTGLSNSIHEFVKKIPIVGDQFVITQLIDGFHNYLQKQPYFEQGDCHVSEEYAWLLNPAAHALERLIETQNTAALGATALSIMLMVPTLRYWRSGDFGEYKGKLQFFIPQWAEVNDALYWVCIEQARARKALKFNEPLVNDWAVSWLGHFWSFDVESLPRLLDYMRTRPLQDDKLVALSTAFQIYMQADKPESILVDLRNTVADNPILKSQLEILLNPPVSEEMKRHQEEMAEYDRAQKKEEEDRKQARDAWIAELHGNPDRVCHPPNLEPGECTNDQFWLLQEIEDSELKASCFRGGKLAIACSRFW